MYLTLGHAQRSRAQSTAVSCVALEKADESDMHEESVVYKKSQCGPGDAVGPFWKFFRVFVPDITWHRKSKRGNWRGS
jgi:hypothetical protein